MYDFFPSLAMIPAQPAKRQPVCAQQVKGATPTLPISLVTYPSFSSFQRNHPITLSFQCYGLIFAAICILLVIFLCSVRFSTVLQFDADFFWRFAAFLLEFAAFFLLTYDNHYIFIFLYLLTSAFNCFSLMLSSDRTI